MENKIRGLHHVTAIASDPQRNLDFYVGLLGLRFVKRTINFDDPGSYHFFEESGNRFRFASPEETAPGRIIDLLCMPDTGMGRVAAGSVHHIAFRAKDEAEQLKWHEHLVDLGYNVTPVIDRTYFHSIYFREPGGVLFEIATDPPGFTLDEKLEELGTHLCLPPWMESARSQIEKILPPIQVPGK